MHNAVPFFLQAQLFSDNIQVNYNYNGAVPHAGSEHHPFLHLGPPDISLSAMQEVLR